MRHALHEVLLTVASVFSLVLRCFCIDLADEVLVVQPVYLFREATGFS